MEIPIRVEPTSNVSATVSDVRLDVPDNPDADRKRKVARTELVDNAQVKVASVKLTICHQHRQEYQEEWTDVDHFNPAQMKKGQEVRLKLNAAETFKLYTTLQGLYQVSKYGTPQNPKSLTIIDDDEGVYLKGRAAQWMRRMADDSSEELWDTLEQLDPYLFKAISLKKLHEVREQAVELFRARLADNQWLERHWEKFFRQNAWIFGYGLNYQFLTELTAQPDYGGQNIKGKGGHRGDSLMSTPGDNRFTVLVEIKRPDAQLLESTPYRRNVFVPGKDLKGGVAQLQMNCRVWDTEGSRLRVNQDFNAEHECHTVQPKGILIVGHTRQLDSAIKIDCFQMYRNSIHNLDVITFDELCRRAEHLLLQQDEEFESYEQKDRNF